MVECQTTEGGLLTKMFGMETQAIAMTFVIHLSSVVRDTYEFLDDEESLEMLSSSKGANDGIYGYGNVLTVKPG